MSLNVNSKCVAGSFSLTAGLAVCFPPTGHSTAQSRPREASCVLVCATRPASLARAEDVAASPCSLPKDTWYCWEHHLCLRFSRRCWDGASPPVSHACVSRWRPSWAAERPDRSLGPDPRNVCSRDEAFPDLDLGAAIEGWPGLQRQAAFRLLTSRGWAPGRQGSSGAESWPG